MIVLALAGGAVLAYYNQWTFVVFLALGWLPFAAWRARKHILIEEVADRTSGDTITNGAATLLTVELAQIQDVFRVVDERNAFPTAVGRQEPLEAAMKVDDFQENLRSSVTSESQLSVGGITIPLRPLMEILGRLVQGPRLRSELHEEGHGREQANRLVLTAQLTGFRRKGTWRIEHELAADATRPDQLRALHEMVGELASRIFTDICLDRKVRWRAMKNFLEALRTFRACLRTPRDRAFNLKEAESHLLQALAEDEDFVLVYYNLGVVYSELRTVAAAHDQPAEAARHLDSAEAAFRQAIEQDPGRWNAYYALARTHYERAQIARKQLDCAPEAKLETGRSDLLKKERGHLRFARDLCERVSTMQAGKKTKADRAKAKDLVAFTYRLDQEADMRLQHRREAYKLSLKALSQTRRKTASRGGEDDPLPALTDLAANCIVNLASDEAGALRTARDLRRSRVPALFELAQRLTSKEGRLHFELGRIALECGDHERARTALGEATRIEPGAARYWAYLASAYQMSGTACGQGPTEELQRRRDDWYVRAQDACAAALEKADLLYGPEEEDIKAAAVVGETYDRLAEAYDRIDPSKHDFFKEESGRLKKMQDFRAELEKLRDEDADSLARLAANFHARNRHWEAAHVAIIAGKKELDQGEPARAVAHFDEAQKWFGAKYPAELARRGVRGRRALAIAKQQPPAGDETLLGALRMAEEAVSVEPLSAFERKLLGEVYASLGDLERARTAWDEALLWSPNDPELHERLGRHVYWRLAEESTDRSKRAEYLVTAEQFLDRAIRLYGNDQYDDRRRILFWLAKLAAAQGKYDDVIRRLRVLQRAPGWEPIAALNLGEAYFRTGRFDEAEPLFREAMAAPKKAASNGAVMRELGKEWDAETLPLRAACWLVRSLTERRTDLEKAGAELEKIADASRRVLEQHPELKAALDTSRGRISWRQGNFALARKQLQWSLDVLPDAETYMEYARAVHAQSATPANESQALFLEESRLYCTLVQEADFRGLCTADIEKLLTKLNGAPAG